MHILTFTPLGADGKPAGEPVTLPSKRTVDVRFEIDRQKINAWEMQTRRMLPDAWREYYTFDLQLSYAAWILMFTNAPDAPPGIRRGDYWRIGVNQACLNAIYKEWRS